MKLQLAEDLAVPISAATEKFAFLGRTGGGKTYAAMKLGELMLEAGVQIVALDPVGVWYGLRIGSKWTVYIFGGLHGDFPLNPHSGALLADLIVDRGICAVLDVSQFIRSEQIRFANDFIVRFYDRKKAAPSAVHLFIEECQEFIPQNVMGEEAKMLHNFERAWKIGRNFGIGGSLISQRPQEINKKALNQAGTLLTFQMTGPQERKAIEAWVADKGIDEDIGALLPKLHVGQPHVWSPAFLEVSKTVRILPKQSADVSITPKVGASAKAQPLTSIDVKQIEAAMVETVEKAKAEDPKELRRQIRELQAELKKGQSPAKEVERVEVSVLTDADRELLASIEHTMDVFETYARDVKDLLRSALDKTRHAPPLPKTGHKITEKRQVTPQVQPVAPVNGRRAAAATDLGKCERAILQVLSQHPEGCDSGKLTLLTGYRYSGGFKNSLSSLRQAGMIDGGNTEIMTITEAGLAQGPFEAMPDGQERIGYWLNHRSFGQCERRILSELIEHRRGLTAEQLCNLTGYQYSGGFKNALSNLRTAGVLVGRNTEVMCASEILFE